MPGRSRLRNPFAFVLAALLLAAALDLYAPRRVDIRRFEAAEVARLDTAMWRSYYERRPVALFFQLAELMRRQFHYPLLRSYLGAARAARAAFLFKDGHDRAEYQRALPDLIDYYQGIHAVSATPFDVSRTAQLELEWWIVHRERARHDNGALERALAEAAAELYRMPAGPMMEYARYRAAAMRIRDEEAAARSLDEQDWSRIERRLHASWRALARAVRPG